MMKNAGGVLFFCDREGVPQGHGADFRRHLTDVVAGPATLSHPPGFTGIVPVALP
jgi:hypothetical protein